MNPWEEFATCVFIKRQNLWRNLSPESLNLCVMCLDGGIDGLVHLSDLSWDRKPGEMMPGFVKQEKAICLETMVLVLSMLSGSVFFWVLNNFEKKIRSCFRAEKTKADYRLTGNCL